MRRVFGGALFLFLVGAEVFHPALAQNCASIFVKEASLQETPVQAPSRSRLRRFAVGVGQSVSRFRKGPILDPEMFALARAQEREAFEELDRKSVDFYPEAKKVLTFIEFERLYRSSLQKSQQPRSSEQLIARLEAFHDWIHKGVSEELGLSASQADTLMWVEYFNKASKHDKLQVLNKAQKLFKNGFWRNRVLGFQKNITEKDLREAFRAVWFMTHPDPHALRELKNASLRENLDVAIDHRSEMAFYVDGSIEKIKDLGVIRDPVVLQDLSAKILRVLGRTLVFGWRVIDPPESRQLEAAITRVQNEGWDAATPLWRRLILSSQGLTTSATDFTLNHLRRVYQVFMQGMLIVTFVQAPIHIWERHVLERDGVKITLTEEQRKEMSRNLRATYTDTAESVRDRIQDIIDGRSSVNVELDSKNR